jgi:ABC-type Fe3+-hydroxamate transport system substrate-binding protein
VSWCVRQPPEEEQQLRTATADSATSDSVGEKTTAQTATKRIVELGEATEELVQPRRKWTTGATKEVVAWAV